MNAGSSGRWRSFDRPTTQADIVNDPTPLGCLQSGAERFSHFVQDLPFDVARKQGHEGLRKHLQPIRHVVGQWCRTRKELQRHHLETLRRQPFPIFLGRRKVPGLNRVGIIAVALEYPMEPGQHVSQIASPAEFGHEAPTRLQ